jgi:hypothetical protein
MEQVPPRLRIETRGWLIEHVQRRLACESERDQGLLLRTAGEVAKRLTLDRAKVDSDLLAARDHRISGDLPDPGDRFDHFAHRSAEFGRDLRDVCDPVGRFHPALLLAVQQELPLTSEQAQNDPDQSRLPRGVRSDQAHLPAAGNREVDATKSLHPSKRLPNRLSFNAHRWSSTPLRPAEAAGRSRWSPAQPWETRS